MHVVDGLRRNSSKLMLNVRQKPAVSCESAGKQTLEFTVCEQTNAAASEDQQKSSIAHVVSYVGKEEQKEYFRPRQEQTQELSPVTRNLLGNYALFEFSPQSDTYSGGSSSRRETIKFSKKTLRG